MKQDIRMAAILERDGRVFLVRERPDAEWELPGGPLPLDNDDIDAEMDAVLQRLGVMAPAITRCPSWNPVTAEPSFSITPTGSCPIVRPLTTGYSPLRMWMSVPQIVVVVILINASRGPTSGTGF